MADTHSVGKAPVVFCSCQRTGSTMIVDDFQNVLGRPSSETEAFWRFVLEPVDGPRNWRDALSLVEACRKDDPVFYDKVMFHYLPKLSQMIDPARHTPMSRPFAEFFANATWVHIRRANVFDQAVSKYIADELGVWYAWQADGRDFNARMDFNVEKAKEYVRTLASEDQDWVRFFRENKIRPIEIFYEDAIDNFPFYLEPLLKSAGISVDLGQRIERRLVKVGNERNVRLSGILREMCLRDLVMNQANMRSFFRHRFV